MKSYSYRVIRTQPGRFILSVGGIGLCIILMLFLLAAYNGVKIGSLEYISKNKADLWVMQRNSSNIMRCTSVLFPKHLNVIRNMSGIKSAAPVLLILSSVEKDGKSATVYLAGYNPDEGIGGPPEIIEGRPICSDNEIVLDEAFSKKYDYHIGEWIVIQNDTLQITGISRGTNAFVIQYAFVTLSKAQSLVNFPIATCYLLTVDNKEGLISAADEIKSRLPDVEVYTHEDFLKNNLKEMQAGFLPFIFTIVIICAVVLTIILSLILSINILERRKDFAIMKILGTGGGFLTRLVFGQSFLLTLSGIIVAMKLFYPLILAIETLTPEITIKSSLLQFLMVLGISGIISSLSALMALHRLRKIYPLEVFYEPA